MKKMYMVGLDSVPLWILEELRKEKGMEGLDRLFSKGRITEMESTLPPMSGPAWSTIYTGLEPGEHGVPDFFVMKKDYTPDIVLYNPAEVPPFWKRIAESGRKCLLITPPEVVDLPEIENVDLITGFPLPAKTNSPMLRKLMAKHRYHGEPDIEAAMTEGKIGLEEGVRQYVNSVRKRTAIAKEAMGNGYDFVYICFTETDRMQHFACNQRNWKDYLLPIYQGYSSFLEYMMKRVDEEGSAMVVLSDHGSQPIRNKFLINCWLVRNGYLKVKEQIAQGMNAEPGSSKSVRYAVREKLLKTKLRRVYDNLPYGMKRFVFKILDLFFHSVSSGRYVRLHLFDYDMQKSAAFAAVSNDPVTTIWINDGRFSNGTVEKRDVARLKGELSRKLASIKSPEGDRLIVDIVDGKEYYGNTKKFIAPDLLVEAKRGYTIDIFNFSKGELYMKPEMAKSGDHIRGCVFGNYPRDMRIDTKGLRVNDISGIVLGYFGLAGDGRLRVGKRRA